MLRFGPAHRPGNHQLKSNIEKGVEGHSRCVFQSIGSAVRTQPLCNPVCMVCGEKVPVQPELPTHLQFETQIRTHTKQYASAAANHAASAAARCQFDMRPEQHSTTYMRAVEVIDRVRKMKTAEHLVIAGRDNPTEDYATAQGFLTALEMLDLFVTSQPVSICHQRY